MKKLLAGLILTSALLLAPTYEPGPQYPDDIFDDLSCKELTEMYVEFGVLYKVSGLRLDRVKTPAGKEFWMGLRIATRDLHKPLRLALHKRCHRPS